jgi:hypothetical protein
MVGGKEAWSVEVTGGHWAGFCGLLFPTVALITTPAASSQTFFAASASFLLPHARSSGPFAITFSTTFTLTASHSFGSWIFDNLGEYRINTRFQLRITRENRRLT